MSALSLQSLNKHYGDTPATRAVSLELAAGSRTAIVGPSGSGKTTLLRLIAGFEFPDSGRIVLDGRTLAEDGLAVPAHQRRIGYVPQDGALFPHLSVGDNIGFGLARRDPQRRQRIDALLETVSLDPAMARRWPHELSGGQQQRVALARALAQQPALMLLDEPFSALDTGLRSTMRQAVARLLADAGITTILVTHDQEEALSFADQLAVMRDGRLVQSGAPAQLYRQPADEETARFLGDAIILPADVRDGIALCALGAVPVSHHAPAGAARILLRPDQLDVQTDDAGTARITGQAFTGRDCMLHIALSPGAEPVMVRASDPNPPATGSRVRLTTRGSAHVFPG